jgi:glycosyltransferase involved in cell wall biosynthesis
MQKKKILFTYTNYSTFVKTDFEILSSEHEVTKYQFVPVKGLAKTAVQFIKQKIYLLINIWKFDVVFIWFADYHSFLPVLFAKFTGKKSFVVIGGYDVANIPEFKYGSLSSPLRKKLTLFTFKHATACLAVVDELEKKIKQVCPDAKTKTIYTGYKFEGEKSTVFEQEREEIILTVSITENRQRVFIKGLDRFRELAENLPDYRFYMIGANDNARHLFEPVPSNLILLPSLKQSELNDYYTKASFYAQFSRSEGLPNALCEGMLYGCIPLGTKVGGIPAAIGNLGLLMDEWNVQTVANYIKTNHNKANRETFSFRIKEKFDLNFRTEKLLKEINQK